MNMNIPRVLNVGDLSFTDRKAYALSVSQDARHHSMGVWSPMPTAATQVNGVCARCTKCGRVVYVFNGNQGDNNPVTGTAMNEDCGFARSHRPERSA